MTRHLLPCRWRCIRASGAAELPRTEVPLHCIGSCHCCVVGCPVAWTCQREQRELALRGDAPALRAGETSLKTKVKIEIVSPLTVRDCAFCWHIVTRSRGEATTGHCSFRMRLLPVVRLSWLHISAATCPCCSAPSGCGRRAIRTPEGGSTGRVTQLPRTTLFLSLAAPLSPLRSLLDRLVRAALVRAACGESRHPSHF